MPDRFFRIEMLPAKQGDALWVEYGTAERTRRVLIDAGPLKAFPAVEARLKALPEGDKRVELFVITHVDTDHIEGAIRLLAMKRPRWLIEPQDIWFNGWRHLQSGHDLGGREGDILSALIRRRAFAEWNKAFNREAVKVEPGRPLPRIPLEGGLTLTVLAPDADKLKGLVDDWRTSVEKQGYDPGDLDAAWEDLVETTKFRLDDGLLGGPEDFTESLVKQLKPDPSAANGTSIAFLAEFGAKSCLFLGDAHPDLLCDSIRKLIPAGKDRLAVNAVKVSHHGSRYNINADLVQLLDAEHFLFSSNGDIFHHPNKAAIEAAVRWSVREPTLWFNYRSEYTTPWEQGESSSGRGYSTRYPAEGQEGITLKL